MKLTNTASKSLVALAALVALGAGAGLTGLASAAETATTAPASDERPARGPGMGHGRGVHGTVSSITGSTLQIANADGTSYTIEAGDAKVSKMVELSVSDLQVGDEVGVMGEVDGTAVTARHIMSGTPPQPQAPPSDN